MHPSSKLRESAYQEASYDAVNLKFEIPYKHLRVLYEKKRHSPTSLFCSMNERPLPSLAMGEVAGHLL